MEFLTRKYGGVPAYVIGGGALVVALLFFYFRRQGASGSSGTSGGQPGLPAVSPAASAVPFVPSVTVTGIPPSQPSAVSTPGSTNTGFVSARPELANASIWLHSQPDAASPVTGIIGPGASLPSAGPAVSGSNFRSPQLGMSSSQWIPVRYAGGTAYASAVEVTVSGGSGGGADGGQGGFGMAGQSMGVAPMFGWTAGWQPAVASVGTPVRGGSGGRGGGASAKTTARPRAVAQLRRARLIGR